MAAFVAGLLYRSAVNRRPVVVAIVGLLSAWSLSLLSQLQERGPLSIRLSRSNLTWRFPAGDWAARRLVICKNAVEITPPMSQRRRPFQKLAPLFTGPLPVEIRISARLQPVASSGARRRDLWAPTRGYSGPQPAGPWLLLLLPPLSLCNRRRIESGEPTLAGPTLPTKGGGARPNDQDKLLPLARSTSLCARPVKYGAFKNWPIRRLRPALAPKAKGGHNNANEPSSSHFVVGPAGPRLHLARRGPGQANGRQSRASGSARELCKQTGQVPARGEIKSGTPL